MNAKTENLILYICYKMKDNNKFGSTVLNKVLYYVDNVSYVKTGEPVSELTYVKQEQGPTPKPSQFMAIRNSLVSSGKLEIASREFFGKIQKKPVAVENANLESFSPLEISLIDEIIDYFKSANATEVSEFSHNEISWQMAKPFEELPFYTYLLTKESLTENDIIWANSIIQQQSNAHSGQRATV